MNFFSKAFILSSVFALACGCNSNPVDTARLNQAGLDVPPIAAHPAQPSDDDSLSYLTPTSIPVGTWLQAPFSAGSNDEQKDLAAVLALQSSRSEADCKRAKTEVDITLDSFFGPAYGPLTEDEVSELSSFFDKIVDDAGYAAGQEKNYWKRPRPYLVDSDIHPCVKREGSYSYPSGHSTIAHTTAAVLDLLFPSRQVQIDSRANQIAEDRVLGGVHYPSDIAAGLLMSQRVFEAIQQNAGFQQDLKTAEINLH